MSAPKPELTAELRAARAGTFIDSFGREVCSKCGWPTDPNMPFPYNYDAVNHYPCVAPYEWAALERKP